jgi:hypothetical protein
MFWPFLSPCRSNMAPEESEGAEGRPIGLATLEGCRSEPKRPAQSRAKESANKSSATRQSIVEAGSISEAERRQGIGPPVVAGEQHQLGSRPGGQIEGSNFARFDVNPNTGETIGRERRWVVADNTVESSMVCPLRLGP